MAEFSDPFIADLGKSDAEIATGFFKTNYRPKDSTFNVNGLEARFDGSFI
jgi:hypothetical protein